MEKLGTDFPKARIVFENFPLTQHPEAATAAAYGVVRGEAWRQQRFLPVHHGGV